MTLLGIIKCKLGNHFWAGIVGKDDYRWCIRCDKEEYNNQTIERKLG